MLNMYKNSIKMLCCIGRGESLEKIGSSSRLLSTLRQLRRHETEGNKTQHCIHKTQDWRQYHSHIHNNETQHKYLVFFQIHFIHFFL